MKNLINKILLVALVTVLGGALAGCVPEQGVKKFSVSYNGFGPGYASLMVTVPSATTISYVITEEPYIGISPQILNLVGTKNVIYKDGEHQLLDYEIVENTKYYVYLVGLLGETFSELYTFEFETGEFVFDQIATVVGVLPDGYKMHLSMPRSVTEKPHATPGSRAIRYSHANLMMYNLRRESSDDYEFLLWNGGRSVRRDTTLVYNDANNYGEVGYDADEDGDIDEHDKGMLWDPIAPGEPIVHIAAEFEYMKEPEGMGKDDNYVVNGFSYPGGWDPGYYLPCLDSAKYWGIYKTKAMTKGAGAIHDIDLNSEVDYAWNGQFQRMLFRTRVPEVLDGKFEVSIEDLRSVDATVIITPVGKIFRYLFTILDDASYQYMLKLLNGREEYLQWAVTSYFAMMNFGAIEVAAPEGDYDNKVAPIASIMLSDFYYSVPSDTKYHVLITGMEGEIGTPQCFHHSTFSTPKKTKDYGPDITVTALPDESTPFLAAFNVKCEETPENPLVSCYYGANYYKDWVLEVNSGSTYETLGQTNQFTAKEIEKICSPEGYTMYIPSIDGAKTRLVVVGWNDENISNGVDTYEDVLAHPAVADCTTPYAEAEDLSLNPLLDPMESNNQTPLLNGDWTLTATVLNDGKEEVQRAKVSIKNALVVEEDYPANLPDSVLAIYKSTTKWDDDQIYGYFDQFKNLTEEFNEKRLRNQNQLLLEGWLDNDSEDRLMYMSPWDVFASKSVTTVDVESCFTEFGPKLYLKVLKDQHGLDSLALTADMYHASPAANWSVPFYLAGYANQESYNTLFYFGTETVFEAPLEFPVELSEDKNTLTIKGFVANNTKYYPNIIGKDYSMLAGTVYILDHPIVSDVVLTRGWNPESQEQETPAVRSSSWGQIAYPVTPEGNPKLIEYSHRTRFERQTPKEVQKIDYKILSYEEIQKNLDKYRIRK